MPAMPCAPPFSRVALWYSVFRSPPDQNAASKSSDADVVFTTTLRLVKMMLHETIEAMSSRISTMITGQLAPMTRLTTDISSSACISVSLKQRSGHTLRFQRVRIQERHFDAAFEQQ